MTALQSKTSSSLRFLARVVPILARLILAGLFVYAGMVKLRDPTAFLEEVRGYQILADPWAAVVAISLPWIEIFAGLALLSKRFVIGGSFVITLLLLGFIQALVSAMYRGLDIRCGCFGSGEPITDYTEILIRDGVLLALSLIVLVTSLRRQKDA